MKRLVSEEEWYPHYVISDRTPYFPDGTIELSDEEYKDYRRVRAEYLKWQEKLKSVVDA